MGRNSKVRRLNDRRRRINRRRRWDNRVHKFKVGDLVCACGGHGVIKEIELSYPSVFGGASIQSVEDEDFKITSDKPNDAELTLVDGRYCSAWHCGIFVVKNEYQNKWGKWCSYCGYNNKDEIINPIQKWYKGVPKWSTKADYKTKRAFLLLCLTYAHKAPCWVRKSFQLDLVKLRSNRASVSQT